jgi:hypothetical protein
MSTDNIGVIFMAENRSSGVLTRHIDTIYHFIQEHVEDNFTEIVLWGLVRHNGMRKHSVPMYRVYIF